MAKRHLARIEDVTDFQNLCSSFWAVRRGKRAHREIQAFERNLEMELVLLKREILSGHYHPGDVRSFVVYEPKRRPIYCLPFRDRVVQYAIYESVLKPAFQDAFLNDNVACQLHKGMHLGLHRVGGFFREAYRRHGLDVWILKADIRKYFESIDPDIVRGIVWRHIKGPAVIQLLDTFIEHGRQVNGGVPIGWLTSQYFGLLYLHAMDHMIRDDWGFRWYLRYMDDFLIAHPSKTVLKAVLGELTQYLATERLLQFNSKTQLMPLKNGVDFLGFHTYCLPDGRIIRRLRRKSKDNMRRRLRVMHVLYQAGEIKPERIRQRISGWVGHAKHGNTYSLRQHLLSKAIFRKDDLCAYA